MRLGKLSKLIVLSWLFFGLAVWSAPAAEATMYTPGQTLSPNCAPTDSNCGVITPVHTSDTLTNGALVFASSSIWSILAAGTEGQVLKMTGGLPVWGSDAGGISYTAGSGLSLSGASFALDLTNANTWSGIQSFSNGFILGGNTYTSLAGSGLSFSSGTLSAVLGTTVETGEITDGTITAADLADGTITFGKIGQNACASGEIMKWNGSAWACAVDSGTSYLAGAGLSLSSSTFALDINSLNSASSLNATDTLPLYTASGLKKITRSDLFSDVLGALNYRGTWNATTNSPDLAAYCAAGTKGYYYVVGTAGTIDLDGIASWSVNDWAVCNGTSWEKVQTTNSVSSVFGRTGAIIASSGDYNASQITSTPSGTIAAGTVQAALDELDSEKLAASLNSGLLWIGNSSNVAAAVAMAGDITISNQGTTTIANNAVALATDTTGNYVATIADSGSNIISVANSGSENAGVTLGLVDDSLNFSKLADSLTLDAGTSITLGGNDLTFAITGGGLPKFTKTAPGQWLNFSDGTDTFGVFNSTSTPEGAVAADKGSLAVDTANGKLYIKTSDTLNTGWQEFGLATNGLLSLNGLSGQTQTFAVGTSGTAFNISSVGTTHTLNLPYASATAIGLMTTSTQTIAGAKTFSNALTMGANIVLNNNYLSGDGGNEGLFVDASGNVGVGVTSSLASKFSVSNISASNVFSVAQFIGGSGAVGDYAGIGFVPGWGGAHPNPKIVIAGQRTGNYDIGDLVFLLDNSEDYNAMTASDEKMRITSAGNVGIGTSSPDSRLHILNSSGAALKLDSTGGNVQSTQTVIKFTNFGYAVPSNVNNESAGDKLIFWNNTSYKSAIGSEPSTMFFQSSDNGLAQEGQFKFYAGSTGSPTEILKFSNTDLTLYTNAFYVKKSTGYVGIGMTNPSVALDVTGDIEYTGTITDVSDSSQKENIVSLESSLEKLLNLNAVSFSMIGNSRKELGFIAQNVQEYFPELVSLVDPEKHILGLNYVGLIAPTIQAIQEQQVIIDSIKSQLAVSAGSGVSLSALDESAALGALVVEGQVAFGKDTVGEAVVRAGATAVEINFATPYAYKPIVTISKVGAGALSDYYVENVSKTGFKIIIEPVQSKDIIFSWHAFNAKNGVRFFSDGVQEPLEEPLSIVNESVSSSTLPLSCVAPQILNVAGTACVEAGSVAEQPEAASSTPSDDEGID